MIGGTGTISSAITRQLAESEHELWLLNRGNRQAELPAGVNQIVADVEDEQQVAKKLGDMQFDVVCEFIGFLPEQVARDIRLFSGRTRQYVYISSASAYNKPARGYIINEGTTLANPHWEYSRNKIACEELLMKHYRDEGFPVTIIRPSHTYCERSVPLGIHGMKGSWQVVKRMMEGKPVLIQGDGSSLSGHRRYTPCGTQAVLCIVFVLGRCLPEGLRPGGLAAGRQGGERGVRLLKAEARRARIPSNSQVRGGCAPNAGLYPEASGIAGRGSRVRQLVRQGDRSTRRSKEEIQTIASMSHSCG